MRHRSNSGVRLDLYRRMVYKTILTHQHPVSGLLPSSPSHKHAWIRDNVYSSLSIWALALCYKKKADVDEDRAKAYELEMATVKLMRGLLKAMMRQVGKVEKFKYTQKADDSLHAKFTAATGLPCVGDSEWGHLQIDAISLFLLQLAQMTASGLQIIYSLDEVTFIQNLVFYIQLAFRTPDFGMWERGDKTNHGVPELNATSIGMARAALEAMNGLDLLGSRGGPDYIINVMPDESQQCLTVLNSVLPRESNSKETDAGLLSIISYPAFAVDNQELINVTKATILDKLKGRYGICRFLRDGYKTAKEDPNRLHYYPSELQSFENIECEWPMFFAYLVLDGLFTNNKPQVEEYMKKLEEVMIKGEQGMHLMPELYAVPFTAVDAEVKDPKSQGRIPVGKVPHMWGQSLYVLCKLIHEGFISTGEVDPLNRRLVAEPKPEVVVQVVVLAEDKDVQEELANNDLSIQTFEEVGGAFHVYQANILSFLLSHLGKEERLGLSGRPTDGVGVLATSKIYMLGDYKLVFFPQFVDQRQSYLPLDTSFLVDMVKTDVQYLGSTWNMLGRPLIVVPIRKALMDDNGTLHAAIVSTIRKLQTGYLCGTRVSLGNLSDFSSTSCIGDLSFLIKNHNSPDLEQYLHHIRSYSRRHSGCPEKWLGCKREGGVGGSGEDLGERRMRDGDGMEKGGLSEMGKRTMGGEGDGRDGRNRGVHGIIKRSLSIQLDAKELPSFVAALESGTSTSRQSLPRHLKGIKGKQRQRVASPMQKEKYEGLNCEELAFQLLHTDCIFEQADIVHYLYLNKGVSWDTGLGTEEVSCTVKDLLRELYEKAGREKMWWLVRHTAGLLRMRVEDLAKAASDIIVRQKQLAVGLPPEPREKIITRPMRTEELAALIHEACQDDSSTAMLTQELLVYLAMYMRTEPKLFKEMLRIRVGLIIQLMASELAHNLDCSSEEEITSQLLNLSPHEMKLFLHHILSGKEFFVNKVDDHNTSKRSTRRLSMYTAEKPSKATFASQNKSDIDQMRRELRTIDDSEQADESNKEDEDSSDKKGQWIRRRRLDGALNRVPVGFYTDVWKLMKRCHGISFAGNTINQSLTSEMTQGEMKFALEVESMLNKIALPKYRQLCVETIVMLCLIVEHDGGKCFWNQVINIDQLVQCANELFVNRQKEMVKQKNADSTTGAETPTTCAQGISDSFYDCAPSGRYGTMSHVCRSIVHSLALPCKQDGNLDCLVQ